MHKIFSVTTLTIFLVISITSAKDSTSYVDDKTVTDIDGNIYKIVTIGDQVWMAENLKVIHYRNGDAIDCKVEVREWMISKTGAFCSYDNDEKYTPTYGLLYNYPALVDDRGIAPSGWHLPTYTEWQTLFDYLGGISIAGGKLKDTSSVYWSWPNSGATGESGFIALPGGYRNYDGKYNNIGTYSQFWSSTEDNSRQAWRISMNSSGPDGQNYNPYKQCGFSVRCIKD